MNLCQVLSGELSLVDPYADLGIDFVERALERGIEGAASRDCGGEAGAQEAVVEPREEQRGAKAKRGDAITKAVGQALDQAVQAQTAQLIGDGALRDRFGIACRQGSEMTTQIGGAEAFRKLPEQDHCLP